METNKIIKKQYEEGGNGTGEGACGESLPKWWTWNPRVKNLTPSLLRKHYMAQGEPPSPAGPAAALWGVALRNQRTSQGARGAVSQTQQTPSLPGTERFTNKIPPTLHPNTFSSLVSGQWEGATSPYSYRISSCLLQPPVNTMQEVKQGHEERGSALLAGLLCGSIFLGEAIPRSKLLLKYKWLTSAPFLRADCDYRFIWKQTGHCNSKGRDNQDLLHQVHKLMIQIQKTWIWSLALPLTGNLLNFSGYPFPHL